MKNNNSIILIAFFMVQLFLSPMTYALDTAEEPSSFLTKKRGRLSEEESPSKKQKKKTSPHKTSSPPRENLKHFYGLEKNHPDCSSLSESRICVQHDDLPETHKKWHTTTRKEICALTTQIRTLLSLGFEPDKTNLLKVKIGLSIQGERGPLKTDELLFDMFFVSGWPALRKKNIIETTIPPDKLYFLSSLISNFDFRYRSGDTDEKHKIATELRDQIIKTSPSAEEHSYLIEKRKNYRGALMLQRLFREKNLVQDIQMKLLHTEQGLLFFLSQDENFRRIIEKLKGLIPSESKEMNFINIDFHIASHLSVCLLCGDRLFLEGEWGKVFLSKLKEQLVKDGKNCHDLKGRFWVSYNEPRKDYDTDDRKPIDITAAITNIPLPNRSLRPYIQHIKT